MSYKITYTYSPESSERISKEFLLLRNGRSTVFSVLILGIVGVIASFSPSFRWVGGFFVALVLIYVLQFVSYIRRAKKLANDLQNNSVVVKFNDENVAFQNNGHTSTVEWKRFSQVWITKHAWLFFIYSTDSYTAVPMSSIDEKLSSFILSKVAKDNVRDFQNKRSAK